MKGKIIMVVTIMLFMVGSTIYLIRLKENQPCDKVIKFNDGTTVTCKNHNSYDNGMTHYRNCSGDRVEVPTVSIKQIK